MELSGPTLRLSMPSSQPMTSGYNGGTTRADLGADQHAEHEPEWEHACAAGWQPLEGNGGVTSTLRCASSDQAPPPFAHNSCSGAKGGANLGYHHAAAIAEHAASEGERRHHHQHHYSADDDVGDGDNSHGHGNNDDDSGYEDDDNRNEDDANERNYSA